MPVVQQGSINTTALIVPNAYIQIVPPQVALLNGNPTNILGVVGTAQWGPVNSPTVIGSMAAYAAQFGAVMNRLYDMGTAVAAAVLQGAANFRCVRVTDGTDAAATIVVQSTCITFTSKYTGSLANADTVTIANGSQTGTFKATVARAGLVPEVFDNIGFGLTANPLWVAIAAAINNGVSGIRGPSQLIVASAGAGTTAPALATYTLAGGVDGVATLTSATFVGLDTVPRKGMYALRNTGASVAFLADVSDTTSFAAQVAYALSEGTYMVGVSPAGDTIANAATVKGTAGINSYAFKYLFGDWVYWLDSVNNVTRLISPQGFVAGMLSNLSPEQSGLNKQLYGIVGTQKSMQNQQYSDAELQLLGQADIDVITNPVPGGSYFGSRFGGNSSSNMVINGDNYTRMTNYIAFTLSAGMGRFVGKLQGNRPDDSTRRQTKATLDAFFENMRTPNPITGYGMIDDFSVILNQSNNPSNRVALGYMQADVKVVYLGIVENLIVNLEGGTSVSIARQQVALA
jgi:hypothetical protein